MKEKIIKSVFIIYIISILLLSLRPKIPAIYDNFLPGSDIGSWSMYKYLLDQDVECYFISLEKDTLEIDWRQHFYHSTFTSSAHSNYNDIFGKEFIAFLKNLNGPVSKKTFMKKNNSTISMIKDNNLKGSIFLDITLVRQKKDTTFHKYSLLMP